MNIKKIIPLSLATLSVMGAFTACSDNKVVGADEQTNTMAELSSSSVEPGSSNSLIVLSYLRDEGTVAALTSVSKRTAVTYSHIAGETGYQTDSVTAHESFDRAVQSILNIDPTVRLIDEKIPSDYSTYKMNRQTYMAMKDEDGLVHGDILFRHGYESFPEIGIDVSCGINYVDIDGNYVQMSNEDYFNSYFLDNHFSFMPRYEVHFNGKDHKFYKDLTAIKYLLSVDSTVREEFRMDCALDNGELVEDDGLQMTCHANAELKDGVQTYTDPYWKKYATYMIESCVLARSIDDFIQFF